MHAIFDKYIYESRLSNPSLVYLRIWYVCLWILSSYSQFYEQKLNNDELESAKKLQLSQHGTHLLKDNMLIGHCNECGREIFMPIHHSLEDNSCTTYQSIRAALISSFIDLIQYCITLLFLKDILHSFWPEINLIAIVIIYLANIWVILLINCTIYIGTTHCLKLPSLKERLNYIINPIEHQLGEQYPYERLILMLFSPS